jgi:SOS regulatory protein LexA
MPQDRLQQLIGFYQKHHRMPSYGELVSIFNFKTKSAAYKIIAKMLDEGLVKKDRKGKLLPSRIFNEIPILGTVVAGWPSPAEEEIPDTVSLDDYLIRNKEATYLFKVKGDSMIGAGIMDGDMALVERGPQVKDGDIVLAEIDREWTLKYFRKRGGKVYLEAANKKYGNIYPNEELKIAAVLVSVIRKYKS